MFAWLLCWFLGIHDPSYFPRQVRDSLILNDGPLEAIASFQVGKVTGPGGRAIACGGWVNVKWNAKAMPKETWCYDVTVFSSDGNRPIRTVVPCFPHDEVGFASFYPWTEAGLHPNHQYLLAIVPLDTDLQVLEEAVSFSPPFEFPACPVDHVKINK